MAAIMRFSSFAGSPSLRVILDRISHTRTRLTCPLGPLQYGLSCVRDGSNSVTRHYSVAAAAATALPTPNTSASAVISEVSSRPSRWVNQRGANAPWGNQSETASGRWPNQRDRSAEPQTVEGELRQLDDQVRRWGRVDKEQVRTLLKLVAKEGTVTPQHGVILLRSTGNLLVKESPAERVAIFEDAWKQLQTIGVQMNIQMMNTVLKVKLENGQTFSPAEVLADMENNRSLLPNRITYQFLIAQFCESGDIDGASKILEHMKTQNMSINESVFNTLIKGHMRKGDVSGAKEVLKSMRDAGLEPSSETYKTLMCSFAEKGDLENVKQTLSDAEKADVVLNPSHLFDVVAAFTVSGHGQHIDTIIGYIQSRGEARYNQDAMNCLFQLIANGYDNEAYKVFLCMSRSHYDDKETRSLGRVIVRAMVIKGRAVEKVMEMSQRLIADGFLTEQSIDDIAFFAFTYQSPEYILRVLDNMKAQGRVIHGHYYHPVIKGAAKAGDLNGVLAVIPRLLAVTFKEERDTIIESVYPMAVRELIKRGVKADVLLSGLKTAGLSDRDLEAIRVALEVATGNFSEAAKLVKEGNHVSIELLRMDCAEAFVRSKYNIVALLEFLELVNRHVSGGAAEVNTAVLVGSLNKKASVSTDVLKALVSAYIENDLKLCKSYENLIKKELSALNLSEGQLLKLQALFVSTGGSETTVEQLKAATVEQLESWTARAKRVRSPNLKRLQKWLLSEYCEKGMVEKAGSLKTQLDAEGFIYSEYMLSRFIVLAARDKSNLKEALQYLQQLEVNYPAFSRYASAVLHIADLQMKSGLFDDALKTLTDYSGRHNEDLKQPGIEDGYRFADLCKKLVLTCGEHVKEPGRDIRLTDALFDLGYIKTGTYSVLEALIEINLQQSNDDGVLKALEHCITKYNKTPLNDSVFRHFIAKEDVDRLQTAVDLVSSVFGEQNVLLHLVACFIECGKLKQARKIMETPGLKASTTPLVICCTRFINLDKGKELEQLVDVTKGLYGIDRDEMLLQLIRYQAKRKDVKKLLEVFSLFEEEALMPRNRTLRYVAKVLQSLNEPVPFDVPESLNKTNLNAEGTTARRNPKQRRTTTLGDETSLSDPLSARKRTREPTTRKSASGELLNTPPMSVPLVRVTTPVISADKTKDVTEGKSRGRDSPSSRPVEEIPAAQSSHEVEARKAMEEKDFERILKIKEELLATGGTTKSSEFIANLVRYMLSKRLDGELRKLFYELSKIGDVESLVAVQQVKLPGSLNVSLHRSIFQANIHRNQGEDTLKHLKTNAEELPKYVGTGTIRLLAEKQPDLLPALAAEITDYTSKTGSKNISPMICLFNHYVLVGDSDKARTLLNDFPIVKEKLALSYLCRTAKQQKREDILHELLTLFKEGQPSRRYLTYNYLLQLKCEKGDWVQALDCYNQALGDGLSFDTFWLRSLQELQTVLVANKQPVPWESDMLAKKASAEPTRRTFNKRKDAAETSDSSDSSDDEKKKKS